MKGNIDFDVYLVLGILVFFALIEIIVGHLRKSKRSKGEWIQEASDSHVELQKQHNSH